MQPGLSLPPYPYKLASPRVLRTVSFVKLTIASEFTSSCRGGLQIDYLNWVFSSLDDIVLLYEAEKIKTIGTRYMVSSGMPQECANHALVIAKVALSFRAFAEEHKLSIHIGAHSGSVVGGIVGECPSSLWVRLDIGRS